MSNYRKLLSCSETASGNPTATLVEPIPVNPSVAISTTITETPEGSTLVEGLSSLITDNGQSRQMHFAAGQRPSGEFVRKTESGTTTAADAVARENVAKINTMKTACNALGSKFTVRPLAPEN
jgi:hypothetical protein